MANWHLWVLVTFPYHPLANRLLEIVTRRAEHGGPWTSPSSRYLPRENRPEGGVPVPSSRTDLELQPGREPAQEGPGPQLSPLGVLAQPVVGAKTATRGVPSESHPEEDPMGLPRGYHQGLWVAALWPVCQSCDNHGSPLQDSGLALRRSPTAVVPMTDRWTDRLMNRGTRAECEAARQCWARATGRHLHTSACRPRSPSPRCCPASAPA